MSVAQISGKYGKFYYSVHSITEKGGFVSFPQSFASTQSNFLRNHGHKKATHLQNQLK